MKILDIVRGWSWTMVSTEMESDMTIYGCEKASTNTTDLWNYPLNWPAIRSRIMFRNVFCVLLFVLCSFSLVTTMKTVSNIYKRVNWNLYYHIRVQSNSISDSLRTKINIAREKYSSKTFFLTTSLKYQY